MIARIFKTVDAVQHVLHVAELTAATDIGLTRAIISDAMVDMNSFLRCLNQPSRDDRSMPPNGEGEEKVF